MSVLKSSIKTLTSFKPVIFIEYAPYSFVEKGSSTEEFFNFLKKYDYQVFDLNFNKLDRININKGSSIDVVLMKK